MTTILILASLMLVGIRYFKDRSSDVPVQQNFPVIFSFAQTIGKLSPYIQRYLLGNTHKTPFTLEQMQYIHDAAKGYERTQSFGVPQETQEIKINHALFASHTNTSHTTPLIIGSDCKYPFMASRRIFISGMGFGVLSQSAILALMNGAKEYKTLLNTGEAGLPASLAFGCSDLIFQVGVGGFLCKDIHGQYSASLFQLLAQNNHIKMFEIKLSQGAHPGLDGGTVPAQSMTPEKAIARGLMPFREFTTGRTHANVTTVSELISLITLIKRATQKPVGIKICVSTEQELESMVKAFSQADPSSIPDFITVDGAEGGTFASKAYMMRSAGTRLCQSLPLLHQMLIQYHLRDRVRVFASGQLSSPERAAWAFSAGADMIGIARGFMMAMGCVQAMVCAEMRCPSGVAVTNLSKKRPAELKSSRVANYAQKLEDDLMAIAQSCGLDCYSKLNHHHIELIPKAEECITPIRFVSKA